VTGPVVIFGTGGSGTRAIAILAREAGYFMGANLNSAEDSRELGQFAGDWTNRYLDGSGWIESVCEGSDREEFPPPGAMAAEFEAAIEQHREGIEDPDRPWGWKAPRTILLLPFVHDALPSARFVHLVRDGRDMAHSRNQNQLQRHGRFVLPPSDKRIPRAYASIMFWARVNVAAARYAERFIEGGYLRLRYEDLCSDPGGTAVRLRSFLDCPVSEDRMRSVAIEIVRPSDSLGRWTDLEPGKVKGLERRGNEGLRMFGYL
jgi:hypothetical protein